MVNAYVLPLVAPLPRAASTDKLRERAIATPLTIMQSSGGAMSAAAAAERPDPHHRIRSRGRRRRRGRAGAPARQPEPAELRHGRHHRQGGAGRLAVSSCASNSLEVGGGINIAGRLLSGGGYHVRAPAIDIAEVGAGGGSLVRLDAGGGAARRPRQRRRRAGPGLLRPRRRRCRR